MVGATLTAVVAGGSAVLADHRSDGVIYGCVKNRTGALRVVNSPSECAPKSETPIEWNRQGRNGQDGAPGLPGNLALAGQQCPAGQVLSGFDAAGGLVCTSTGGSGEDPGGGTSDADGDGFTVTSGDCDDANPGRHPGAQEVVDGLDNDCDGDVDEGLSPPDCDDGNLYTEDWYDNGNCQHLLVTLDVDGDGHSATSSTGSSPDCDDTDPSTNPDGHEIVGDEKDNDCDGSVDESHALNETDAAQEADFCRLQFPSEMTVSANATSPPVFGLVYEDGLTGGSGPHASVGAQLGIGPGGSDPRSTPGWRFTDATFNQHVGNSAEYGATVVTPGSPGTYGYVYRFSFNNGADHTYCDLAGAGSDAGADFDPRNLGTMTVV